MLMVTPLVIVEILTRLKFLQRMFPFSKFENDQLHYSQSVIMIPEVPYELLQQRKFPTTLDEL